MSLQDLIAADASAVFLNTAELAIQIRQNPLGVTANAVTIAAVVDLGEEGQFQGPRIDDRSGAMQLRYGRLEILSTIAVSIDKRREKRDTFTINGELWQAERQLAQDSMNGLQTIEISREEHIMARTSRA